jgi:hypothetical protein
VSLPYVLAGGAGAPYLLRVSLPYVLAGGAGARAKT